MDKLLCFLYIEPFTYGCRGIEAGVLGSDVLG